jgi:2-polyprenyl-3-methyl-5-hydroxy-6-metoxy-1,4-benzoquinol methylase
MVDIRNATGIARWAGQRLEAFNQRHPWSHNDHFHGWILRHLPESRARALDVGCGRGALVAALATRFSQVEGVDADAEMARVASERFAGNPRITIHRTPFDQVTGVYDLITMVAVLHHLDLEAALGQVDELLAPGGRFLAVGLARSVTPVDLVWDLGSALLNPLMGMAKHPRRAAGGAAPSSFPVRDPVLTYDQVRAAAERILPGARPRRRLSFRYSLDWTKPQPGPASP